MKTTCLVLRSFSLGIVLFVTVFFQSAYGQFAKGADVSWLTQMEASGIKFYNSSGTQQDLFTILSGKGMNSIRLRVWVNPSGGWCNQADVIAKAKRAKAAGMRIMIDFHYSDTWADPGQQTKPSAWSSHAISALYTDVWNYTTTVLTALKSAGITPEWVQVGNETNNGMLWNDGKASVSMSNFAGLVTSGYNATKSIFSGAKVVVHLSNGYDNSLFRWMFDGLKTYGAKYDVIGMSLYPSTTNWSTLNSQCLTNMNDMVSRYGKQVMICEVGMDVTAASTCKSFLIDIMNKVKSVSGGKGLGVFYWEPECYNSWQGYGKGAFGTNGRPTVALDAFTSVSAREVAQLDDVREEQLNIIKAYPNPSEGQLNIVLPNDFKEGRLTIYNNVGQVVQSDQLRGCVSTLDVGALVSGVYTIKISNANGNVLSDRFVKK